MKVSNMTNSNGRTVPNQFIIYHGAFVYFQSYETIIARKGKGKGKGKGKVVLDKDSWDFSATTGKYRNQFLSEGIVETRKKIASGEYKLVNLN